MVCSNPKFGTSLNPKRGGRVASLSSIRSTALRNSYEYHRALTTELSLLQRRGGARKPINTFRLVRLVLECIT